MGPTPNLKKFKLYRGTLHKSQRLAISNVTVVTFGHVSFFSPLKCSKVDLTKKPSVFAVYPT